MVYDIGFKGNFKHNERLSIIGLMGCWNEIIVIKDFSIKLMILQEKWKGF